MNYINLNDDIKYFDGIYITRREFMYLGHLIPKDFGWNGVTMWRTSDNMIYPSMLHDFLLLTQPDRKFADKEFLRSMKFEEVFILRRWKFYSAVRLNSRIKEMG